MKIALKQHLDALLLRSSMTGGVSSSFLLKYLDISIGCLYKGGDMVVLSELDLSVERRQVPVSVQRTSWLCEICAWCNHCPLCGILHGRTRRLAACPPSSPGSLWEVLSGLRRGDVTLLPRPALVMRPRDTSWGTWGVHGAWREVCGGKLQASAVGDANAPVTVRCARLRFMLS